MKQIVTIKVIVKTEGETINFVLATNGMKVGGINPDWCNKGKYQGHYEGWGACNNSSLPHAFEFVGDGIEKMFSRYGIAVEFDQV